MNYVHTLSFNLVTETEKAVRLLYELNDKKDFKHVIVDLDFPIEEDEVPKNFSNCKKRNTNRLKKMALEYGSDYVKFENKGVSDNWTQVFDYFNVTENDILICADPDEHPKDRFWIRAIEKVIKGDPTYGWVSLVMPEHFNVLNKNNTVEKTINKERVWDVLGVINWAQGGFNGKFLKEINGIPGLETHPIYGNIEAASLIVMKHLGYKWCILPDYIVEHTDFEVNSEGSSSLLREWKNFIIYNIDRFGQISFEQYLNYKKEGIV